MRSIYLFILIVLVSFTFVSIPFARDEKRMPSGNWETMIPKNVAGYEQIAFQTPTTNDDGAAYYKKGTKIIYISFNKLKDDKQLQEWMDVAKGDLLREDSEVNKVDLNGSNKYVLYGRQQRFFFAWSRGLYYFDVLCEHGKDEMDAFMKAFPY